MNLGGVFGVIFTVEKSVLRIYDDISNTGGVLMVPLFLMLTLLKFRAKQQGATPTYYKITSKIRKITWGYSGKNQKITGKIAKFVAYPRQ